MPSGLPDFPDWMRGIDGGLTLRELSIPGTHETCSTKGGDMWRTQTHSLASQLKGGIRFIDIRCRQEHDKFRIFHEHENQHLSFDTDVLDVCISFLRQHPDETIIMSVKHEGSELEDFFNKDYDNCDTFAETFWNYVKGDRQMFWLEDKMPTLDEARGRIVVLRRFGKAKGMRQLGIKATGWKDDDTFKLDSSDYKVKLWIQDRYKVKTSVDFLGSFSMSKKWNRVKDRLRDASDEKNSDYWFLNFVSGASSGCYPRMTAMGHPPEGLNDRLRTFLKKENLSRTGTVIMDFPEHPGSGRNIELIKDTNSAHRVAGFTYNIGQRSYYFCQDLDSKSWTIRELHVGGHKGDVTAKGTWKNPYHAVFKYEVGGKHYMYGQNLDSKRWFIQELTPNGKFGKDETDNGKWKYPYEAQFPFNMNGRQFFLAQSMGDHRWFIQELNGDGTMGKNETANGRWKNPYRVMVPFKIGSRQFFYGHDLARRAWFTQELNSDGTLGDRETDDGQWKHAYGATFAYEVAGKHFLYGQNLAKKNWFIQELRADGTLATTESDSGTWKHAYSFQVPFQVDGKTYFLGRRANTRKSFIQELLPNGKMGKETTKLPALVA